MYTVGKWIATRRGETIHSHVPKLKIANTSHLGLLLKGYQMTPMQGYVLERTTFLTQQIKVKYRIKVILQFLNA